MFAADKRTVSCAAQESRLHELFDYQTRLIRIEIPQALKLPVRETQTGTLMELAADALKHGFETGQTGHVGQFGRRSVELVRGAERPFERRTLAIRLRPYPVLSPMPAYTARHPVPGLAAMVCKQYARPESPRNARFFCSWTVKGLQKADKKAELAGLSKTSPEAAYLGLQALEVPAVRTAPRARRNR
jgi:hypothetical protein